MLCITISTICTGSGEKDIVGKEHKHKGTNLGVNSLLMVLGEKGEEK